MKKLKKLIAILILGLSLGGCLTSYDRQQRTEWRRNWQIEKRLNHDRIVADCQRYNSCKGDYSIYNSDPKKRY